MANTVIPVELSSTPGIVDGSNATAITIDSSENVGIGTTSPAHLLELVRSSTDFGATLEINNTSSANGSVSAVRYVTENETTGLMIGKHSNGFTGGADLAFINQELNSDLAISTNNTERMRIDSSGNVGIGAVATLGSLHVTSSLTDIVTFENTDAGTTGAQLLLYHNSSSPADGDRVGALAFQGKDDGGNHTTYAGIRCLATDVSDGGEDGTLTFSCTRDGSFTEAMRITSGGGVGINTTAPTGAFTVQELSGQVMRSESSSSGTVTHLQFVKVSGGAAQIGAITGTTSSVSYTSGSDYRLKENVITDWDATTLLKQLKPSKFNFKDNQSETVTGFIAHEVQEVLPYLVNGEKDGEDMQSMDYAKLTPLLTKAIQEQQTLIETQQTTINDLKSRIETLEG